MDDFEFTMDSESTQRSAYRTRIPGLEAALVDSGEAYPIMDLSATGLSYLDPGKRHGRGEVLHLDLTIAKRIFLEDVTARVMRNADDVRAILVLENLEAMYVTYRGVFENRNKKSLVFTFRQLRK